jgi:phage tail-like protein
MSILGDISNFASTALSIAEFANNSFKQDPIPNFFFKVEISGDNQGGIGSLIGGSVGKALDMIGNVATMVGLSVPFLNDTDINCAFTEVNGLAQGIEFDTKNEVGNMYPIPFPKGLKSDTLTLKRYVRNNFSDTWSTWCNQTFENASSWSKGITLKDIKITILHPHKGGGLMSPGKGEAVASFTIFGAFPTKREVEGLNSTGNDALQETIEITFREMHRDVLTAPSFSFSLSLF